jgi:hypothetical protein
MMVTTGGRGSAVTATGLGRQLFFQRVFVEQLVGMPHLLDSQRGGFLIDDLIDGDHQSHLQQTLMTSVALTDIFWARSPTLMVSGSDFTHHRRGGFGKAMPLRRHGQGGFSSLAFFRLTAIRFIQYLLQVAPSWCWESVVLRGIVATREKIYHSPISACFNGRPCRRLRAFFANFRVRRGTGWPFRSRRCRSGLADIGTAFYVMATHSRPQSASRSRDGFGHPGGYRPLHHFATTILLSPAAGFSFLTAAGFSFSFFTAMGFGFVFLTAVSFGSKLLVATDLGFSLLRGRNVIYRRWITLRFCCLGHLGRLPIFERFSGDSGDWHWLNHRHLGFIGARCLVFDQAAFDIRRFLRTSTLTVLTCPAILPAILISLWVLRLSVIRLGSAVA